MRVIDGAGELAEMVMSARGREDEAGFKRSLLNYIMAFPVVLKVSIFQTCFILVQFAVITL